MGDNSEKKKLRDIRDVAAGKLAYRARTKVELTRELLKLGYSHEDVEELITDYLDSGYLDDVKYGISFFRYGSRKGWADNRSKRELKKKGLSDRDIERAFSRWMEDRSYEEGFEGVTEEEDRALAVAMKMVGPGDFDDRGLSDKIKARIARRLYSYGYSSDEIFGTIRKIENNR